MQLKRIDIAGFKSFAEKTEIEFNKGITAVVGPNGSGKSNVIEAVRWVMGEQSARNLRGGKMPDIIFSGSESRKPVNRAEVTLVLNNEDGFLPLDYTEVSITRCVNRSGESEFYINKKTCRLKDIVDLFIDSGLGKESFSIISQGEVESILSSKPEERRLIIEEAAGVLKYKDRKKKAEQKLRETTDNVSRVLDIIFELETQIEPLKQQKSIAKDYLSQKEQLRDIEIALTAAQIDQLVKETKEMNQKSTHLTSELKTVQKQMKHTKDNSVQVKEKQKEIRNELDKKQSEQVQLIKTIEQLEGQKILLIEQNKHSEEYKQNAQKKMMELSASKNQIKSEINKIEQLVKKKQMTKEKLTSRLLEAEQELDLLSGDQKKIEAELRDKYIDSMQQETNLKNERNYIEKFANQYVHKKNKVAENDKHLLNKQYLKAKDMSQQKKELKLTQTKAARGLLEYQEIQLELQALKKKREKKEEQFYDALKIIQQAKAKKESLQELNDEYAGFYQGVRKVLQHKHQLRGILGVIAELIEVQEKLTVAIDLALGASSQQVVVETEENAREAIEFLKQKKLGKATFLPLTTIKPRRVAQSVLDKIKSDSGFVGVASNLISYPKQIESIVLSLLGTTIIADSLISANRLASSLNYKYRIVSLEGDIMNAGGSMTGGANKREVKGSLLVRKKEIQTLESQIYTMDQTMQSKEVLIRTLKQQEKNLEIKSNELKESNEIVRFEQQKAKSALSQLVEEEKQLNKMIKVNQFERVTMEEEEKENKIALNSLEQAIIKAQKEKKLIEEQMESVSAENDKKEQKKKELSETIQHCSSTLAALKEQLSYFKKETTRLKEHYDKITEEQQTLKMQFEQAKQSSDSHQLSKQEIKEYLNKTVAKKMFTEKQLDCLKENEKEALKNATKLDQKFTELVSEKQEILEKQSKIEIQKNHVDSAMKTRLNLLNELYSMTFETALREFSLKMTLQEAEQKVRLLKKGLAELGSVNLSSIEEFERVNERYLFLTEQRNDLLLAKNSLQETMDEMDEEVIKRFTNMFEAVQSKFNLVFTELFQGGFAELTLTDPDNLLTTGIDITAQPPGKKLQQLSLLSGGERTLTAIALLFSILLVRPVPFCILDEVEAALDEANVVRFSRYLKKFEKDTQFIVITHRKGTMEEANSLYGITMQETGVSKVVSVRLEEGID